LMSYCEDAPISHAFGSQTAYALTAHAHQAGFRAGERVAKRPAV
jgi:hypothetical protein